MKQLLLVAAGLSLALDGMVAYGQTFTISGANLAGLEYSGDPGDAQYVAASGDVPALASLYTPDSGLDGDSPAVKIRLADVSPIISSFGVLDNFTASYDLYGTPTGPTGTQPYWLTYLADPGGGYIGVVTFGGPDLNGSSLIHVFYDYSDDPLSSDTYFGDTLSELDSTAYGDTTFGQLPVYETILEIGNYDNGNNVIPASANVNSITIAVPEPATWGSMLAGLGMLWAFGRIRRRTRIA